jgi:SAM-dependent methyltransferase
MPPSSPFELFVREHVPQPPARLLEVGCGDGALTTVLAAAGYDVLGIDPRAPFGDRFRRVLLEDLDARDGPFDAVVAARSLHPQRHLDQALDRIVALLRPRGLLVLDEIGWDLADEPTLAWLHEQRCALAATRKAEASASLAGLRAEWEAEHLGVHGFAALRAELDARFEELAFVRTPFLYRLLGGGTAEVVEQGLIDAGRIRALGFRYAGSALSPRS